MWNIVTIIVWQDLQVLERNFSGALITWHYSARITLVACQPWLLQYLTHRYVEFPNFPTSYITFMRGASTLQLDFIYHAILISSNIQQAYVILFCPRETHCPLWSWYIVPFHRLSLLLQIEDSSAFRKLKLIFQH